MQKDAKDLSIKFFTIFFIYINFIFCYYFFNLCKIIKNNIQEIKIVTDKMMKLDKKRV